SRSASSSSSTPGEGHRLRSVAMRSPPRCAKGKPEGPGRRRGVTATPRASGTAPGRQLLMWPVLYNHLPDALQLVLRWQVKGKPGALSLRHVEEEGFYLDPDRRQFHSVLVVQVRLIAEHDLGAEVPLVFQHPGHPVLLHLPLHHCEGGGFLEAPH